MPKCFCVLRDNCWLWVRLNQFHHATVIRNVAQTVDAYASSSFERILVIHCYAARDTGVDVEKPFDHLVIQNRQAMRSMGRSMDWTLKDKLVNCLFLCTTLTFRKRDHTRFCMQERKRPTPVQRRLSRTHAVLGHSRKEGVNVGDESTESRNAIQPFRIPSVIRPERHTSVAFSNKLLSCCGAGTNECLVLRYRGFSPSGWVSAE